MGSANELKVLFATRFSDSCFRSVRAVAQLADAFRVHVTIAHAGPAERTVERELRSFFAEADHYPSCDRVRLEGAPAETLATFARSGAYDLIVAPRVNRLGIPRPLHRSTRAEILTRARTPIWTTCCGLDYAAFGRDYRTIAVFVDGLETDLSHVTLAASFAARVGAQLRLLTVVPPIHEDALVAHPSLRRPLAADVAVERIHQLLGGWSRLPTVDVTTGSPDRELPKMAARCDADLLFLSEAQSCRGRYFRRMRRAVDHVPCGVVVVPTALPKWFRWSFCSAEKPEPVRLLESDAGAATVEPLTQAI